MSKHYSQNLITHHNPISPVSEQFRILRTSIDYTLTNQKRKVLLITSPETGSGKSTTSANLAIIYAQQGKKTLLIDADMRKPTQHKLFEKGVHNGLSGVITEQLTLQDACQPTEIDNLDIMVSGFTPPNPNKILESSNMETILQTLRQQYEVILIDTPPTIVSDALIIAPKTDGILLIMRQSRTLKENAKKTIQQLALTKTDIIGTILNGVSGKKNKYYTY